MQNTSTLTDFVREHLDDDTSRLLLNRSKWPEIDMDLAVNCIESRRKLKGKIQVWYDNPNLIFPLRLSAEQCSSSATALYKADLIQEILSVTTESLQSKEKTLRIADLTGGFGVDSWHFSKIAEKVLYCEMQKVLCDAASHNFTALGADNIEVRNITVSESTLDILQDFKPDIVFIDPARRSESGKKVFLIEECTPDVLKIKEKIFSHCRHILIKLSPMADITMVCNRLGNHCRQIHVIEHGGECKELLIWMDREWSDEYSIHVGSQMSFFPEEERAYSASLAGIEDIKDAEWLFEPGKALMKSGAFNIICKRFSLKKLGSSTHYYTGNYKPTSKEADELSNLGKIYRIIQVEPLDKRTIKAAGKAYPKSEVTARNIPMDTDTLRKKLGITSGDDAHIFGLKSDLAGNLLLITSRKDY